MPHPNAKIKAFQEAVAKAVKRWDDGFAEREKRLAAVFKAYDVEAMSAIASAGTITDWKTHHLQAVERQLKAARETAETRLKKIWNDDVVDSIATDIADSVTKPAAVILDTTSGRPYVMGERVAYLSEHYVPDLITDITSDELKKITGILRRGMMGGAGQSNAKIMSDMQAALGGSRARMRTVFRTEANRIHNIARTESIEDLAKDYPMVLKRWVHRPSNQPRPAHVALHDTRINPAKGETFSVNGHPAKGPHDPALPAEETINCHCGVFIDFDADAVAASTTTSFDVSDPAQAQVASTAHLKPEKQIIEAWGALYNTHGVAAQEWLQITTPLGNKAQMYKVIKPYQYAHTKAWSQLVEIDGLDPAQVALGLLREAGGDKAKQLTAKKFLDTWEKKKPGDVKAGIVRIMSGPPKPPFGAGTAKAGLAGAAKAAAGSGGKSALELWDDAQHAKKISPAAHKKAIKKYEEAKAIVAAKNAAKKQAEITSSHHAVPKLRPVKCNASWATAKKFNGLTRAQAIDAHNTRQKETAKIARNNPGEIAQALGKYQGYSSGLNRELWNDVPLSPDHAKMHKGLTRLVGMQSGMQEECVIRRGVGDTGIKNLFGTTRMSEIQKMIDHTTMDKAWGSCSLNYELADGWSAHTLEILVPKGTRGFWMRRALSGGYQSECEWVMAPGTHYRVVAVRKTTEGEGGVGRGVFIQLEVVEDAS